VEEYLSDKEQWQRVLQWLREQGPWAVTAVAVVAAGYYGWQFWQQRVEQHYVSAANRYEQVVNAFARNSIDDGLRLADQLAKDFPSSAYADEANLTAARIQVEHHSLDQAAARLSQVLSFTKDPELALIARLRLARVQLAQNKPDEALKTLNAVDPGAFAARYAQVRGDILMAKGDRAGALKEYQAARSSAGDTLDTGLLDLKIDELAHS
jgi:predicted negative regulator of RcsB-dependent stress response